VAEYGGSVPEAEQLIEELLNQAGVLNISEEEFEVYHLLFIAIYHQIPINIFLVHNGRLSKEAACALLDVILWMNRACQDVVKQVLDVLRSHLVVEVAIYDAKNEVHLV
jgi:hypothetical protein